ncbi:MAG: hypothetical protein KatS3mg119_2080 [Rhodothalassiaceae bacterium]|nr:MAG: hypothetical protein KatS3mg119_2080 [Rhodothalassiaceae bacterium]
MRTVGTARAAGLRLVAGALAAMFAADAGASAAQTRRAPLIEPPPVPREAPRGAAPASAAEAVDGPERASSGRPGDGDQARVLAELKALAERRRAEAARAEELERAARAAGDEAKALAAERAALALRIRALAAERAAIAAELARLREEIAALEATHARTRIAAARELASLMRLSALPPELLLIAGPDPDEALLAIAAGDARLTGARRVLARLAAERARLAQLADERARLLAAEEANAAAAAAREQELARAISAAEARRRDLAAEAAQARETAQELAARARDLEDLLRRLEEAARGAPKAGALAFDPPPGTTAFAAARGRLVPPVDGPLRQRFGQTLAGGHSRGVAFEGESRAIVVAPWDGRVVYAAPFLGMGVVAIIAHQDGYFSLLAGLEEALVTEGQWVLAGEPVGRLPARSADGRPPRVYFELRQGNRPVDPVPWLARAAPGRS